MCIFAEDTNFNSEKTARNVGLAVFESFVDRCFSVKQSFAAIGCDSISTI